jgi:hypothetical protein
MAQGARREGAVGSIDEAEDLAVLLVDPVLLVVDSVGTLDPEVGLVGARDIGGLHAGKVVHVHVRRHGGTPLRGLIGVTEDHYAAGASLDLGRAGAPIGARAR